jgi:L-aspartate oxidase
MSRHVGVMRRPEGLRAATAELLDLVERTSTSVAPSRASWEATNVLTVASAVVASAATRTESRGCHRRTDYTEPRDIWLTHLHVFLDDAGVVITGQPPEA